MSSPDIAVEPKPIPPEIDRWNWGAFFLSWIWGIGNATPIALLALVPLVGFVMLFVLGARGSRWAWRNKRWDSVEHFKRVQRKWAISGLVIWIAGFGFWAAIFFGTFSILRHSEAYQMRHRKASNEPGGNQRARHADRGWQTVRLGLDLQRQRKGVADLSRKRTESIRHGVCRGDQERRRLDHHPARVQARWQRQRDRHHRRRALKLDVSRAVTPH